MAVRVVVDGSEGRSVRIEHGASGVRSSINIPWQPP